MSSDLLVPPHLDDVARLLSDRSRLRMLWALGDGRAYTATELARVANLSAPAASNHLTRMVDAGFLEVRSQGRHRYFTLTREDIGRAVEAMAAISIDITAISPKLPSVRPALRYARRCYGHLAGECGVAFWDHLVAENLLNADESGWRLNGEGEQIFAALGIQLTRSLLSVRPCLDWTERQWHLGGALGRAALAALQDHGVVAPSPSGDRVLLVDPHRWRELLQQLKSDRSCST